MNGVRLVSLIPAALLCCGCLNSSTLIKVKPDGSGTIDQTLLMNTAALKSMMPGLDSQAQLKQSGPFSEAELKRTAERMGTGVRLVSSSPLSQGGFEGAHAIFAFDDISQVSIDQDPNVGGPAGAQPARARRSPVMFTFARQGPSSVLTVIFDEKPSSDAPPAAPPTPAPDAIDPAMMQMMKMMFQGFKIAIDLEVEGKIVKTNADYVSGSRITLMEIDMAGVLEDEAKLRALQSKAGPGASIAEIKPLLKDVKGVKINHSVVTVDTGEMTVDGPPRGSRLDGGIRLVIVESPDLAAPLVGALDAADVGAWVWVEAERALYFSPRVLDLLGLEVEGDTPLLSRFLHAVHPGDRARVRQLIEGQRPSGPYALRYRFAHIDGLYRWIEDRGRVERDSQDRLVRQGGAMRDISREVAQELARAEATAWLEALVNAMPFGVWGRSGPELTVSHENAVAISRWGDLRGTSLGDLPPEIARTWRLDVHNALSGSVVKASHRYTFEDGVRIFNDILAPVRVGGEITGIVGVQIDVTDEERSREFEALLTEIAADFVGRSSDTLDAALNEALQRIARFLGGSVATLCEISSDSRMRVTHWWIDPSTGRDRPLALEMDVSQFSAFIERLRDNQPLVVNRLSDLPEEVMNREWLTSRQVHSFVTMPARQEDGLLVVLGLAAGPHQIIEWPRETIPTLRLAATLLAGVLARQRAEANRRQVEQRMQEAQKLETLGVLAGGIAHDFNNLLTAILGNASLLRADLPRGAKLQGPLEQIEVASRRAADLCRQMLAYAGRGRFQLLPANVNEIVRQSQSLLRVGLSKKASLELDLAPNLPPVVADPQQLRQVLINLVINAAEAIGDREGTITIRTSEACLRSEDLARTVFSPQLEEGRYVSLSVKDDGAGMPPETLARIFDPFFTTKFTGRGLGLPAVVGIVRVHKGALRVESEPGAGSTFELLLRAQAGESDETAEQPDALADAAKFAEWRTTGTVLVVDDEPGVRDLVRSVLQRLGLTVVVAEDGRSAVDAFRAIAADVRLALVDLTMPGLDGREALAAMRQIAPDLPAIVMSGYTPADIPDAAPDWFLQKPFTPLMVRQAVYKALRGT